MQYFKFASFSLLVFISSGWLGDALKGDCLFLHFWNIINDITVCGIVEYLATLLTALFVFFVAAWCLYKEGRKFFYKNLQTTKEITPHRVLIIAVSNLSPRPVPESDGKIRAYKNGDKNKYPDKFIEFTKSIENDIEAFNDKSLFSQYSPNTQQFLRAVKPHLKHNALKRVFLIGSEGDNGSYRLLGVVKRILKLYDKKLKISCRSKERSGIDFGDVEELRHEYEELVKQAVNMNYKEQDIIIDVTGGQKITSIAAAMVTFRHPKLKFQYIGSGVNNTQELTFNIVAESPSKIT